MPGRTDQDSAMDDAPASTRPPHASVEDEAEPMQEDGAENGEGEGSVQDEEPDEEEVPKVRIVRSYVPSASRLRDFSRRGRIAN